MPGTGEGHHAVDHAAPARRQEDDRHHHTQALRPVRQRGVVQMMRAGPDVDRDDRPEVHDGQAVRVDRPPRLLRHEVVHHPEKADREDEAHYAVPVPPLHHRIGGPRIQRIGLEQAHRHQRVIDDVHHAGDDDEGAEEPVADINVPNAPAGDGAEEQIGVEHPDQRHPECDRPLHLGVFLGRGVAQRVADRHCHACCLPAPENQRRQPIRDQPGMAGALNDVERRGEQRAATEGEDHQIGVDRSQPAEAGPGQVEVQLRPHQLSSDEDAEAHAEHTPDQRHQGELAHHVVVVGNRFGTVVQFAHARQAADAGARERTSRSASAALAMIDGPARRIRSPLLLGSVHIERGGLPRRRNACALSAAL